MPVTGGEPQDDPGQVFAATLLDEMVGGGLRDICCAPGSRSAPLALAAARHPGLRTRVLVDERSCGFFALGLARASGRPVGIIVTSGTAAVELHPAVVEAFQARVPLIVLTADRPPELHDVGANQTIDQHGLYGGATRWSADPGPAMALPGAGRLWRRLAARAMAAAAGPPAGPVHLNCAFREPLVPAAGRSAVALPRVGPALRHHPPMLAPTPQTVETIATRLAAARRPLIVCGGLTATPPALGTALDGLTRRLGAVVIAEPASQLRTRGRPGLVAAAEPLLRVPAFAAGQRPDWVLRLGAPPTSRTTAAWLAGLHPTPTVLVDPDGSWADPVAAATEVVAADPVLLLSALTRRLGRGAAPAAAAGWRAAWERAGAAAEAAITATLGRTPLFEAHVVRALWRRLPAQATVVVGSSLPIRAVDSFGGPGGRRWRLLANRGASGIDGVVSTAAGVAAAGPGPTVLLCGDLTAFHDMNGLWALRRHGLRCTVVVCDNDGGGIFSLLPPAGHPDVFEQLFGTPLGLDWSRVAALYDLDYRAVTALSELDGAVRWALDAPGSTLLTVRFPRARSAKAHAQLFAAVAATVPGPV